MTSTAENLVVRQHERLTCALPAEVAVDEAHAPKIQLTSAALDPGSVCRCMVTDLSGGGVGLRTRVYLPKSARVIVRVLDAQPGVGAFPNVLAQFTVRLMRAQMLDRTPMYYLGGSFTDTSDELARTVARLMQRVRDAGAGGGDDMNQTPGVRA